MLGVGGSPKAGLDTDQLVLLPRIPYLLFPKLPLLVISLHLSSGFQNVPEHSFFTMWHKYECQWRTPTWHWERARCVAHTKSNLQPKDHLWKVFPSLAWTLSTNVHSTIHHGPPRAELALHSNPVWQPLTTGGCRTYSVSSPNGDVLWVPNTHSRFQWLSTKKENVKYPNNFQNIYILKDHIWDILVHRKCVNKCSFTCFLSIFLNGSPGKGNITMGLIIVAFIIFSWTAIVLN